MKTNEIKLKEGWSRERLGDIRNFHAQPESSFFGRKFQRLPFPDVEHCLSRLLALCSSDSMSAEMEFHADDPNVCSLRVIPPSLRTLVYDGAHPVNLPLLLSALRAEWVQGKLHDDPVPLTFHRDAWVAVDTSADYLPQINRTLYPELPVFEV